MFGFALSVIFSEEKGGRDDSPWEWVIVFSFLFGMLFFHMAQNLLLPKSGA